jgi:uncharacterized membrane protein
MTTFFDFPPLHPIFVHFPVAMIPISFLCDVLARLTGRLSLSHAAWWSLLFATIVAPITAATGWFWSNQMGEMDHAEMKIHQWLGTVIPLLLIVLAAWRYRAHSRDATASLSYLIVAGFVLLAVTIQGHLGGMMSFGSSAQSSASVNTAPATQSSAHHHDLAATTTATANDGWSDSIPVKGHKHE